MPFRAFGLPDRAPRLVVWMATASVLAVVGIALYVMEKNLHESAARQRLSEISGQLTIELSRRLDAQALITRALVSHVEFNPDFVLWNYSDVVRKLVGDERGILNVALAPDLVVSRVYPEDSNAAALGLDLRKFEQFRDVTELALEQRRMMLIGPVALAQGGRAFITRAPIYLHSGSGRETDNAWGVASVVLDAEVIFSVIRKTSQAHGIDIALASENRSSGEADVFLGTKAVMQSAEFVSPIFVPGGTWSLGIRPNRNWVGAYSDWHKVLPISYLIVCAVTIASVATALRQADSRKMVERRFFDAVNAIDDGFVIYDERDRFVVCNDAYRQLYAKSADLFVPGMPFSQIIEEGAWRGQYPDAVGRENEWIAERLRRHDEASEEIIQKLDNGRWLKVSERKTATGSTVGFRVDITELREAREAAEKANRVKSEFISMLSHELRTPLTVILGYAKVLANLHLFKSVQCIDSELGEDDPNVETIGRMVDDLVVRTSEQATKIEKSGDHLLVLINDLLDYSKIEAGRFDLHFKTFSTKSLIGSILEDMSDSAFEKGLTLVDDTKEIFIDADEIRLKQVLINLIGNAIKFTDEGTITVSSEFDGRKFQIMVSDTGCGIEDEALGMVFDAFQQVDRTDKRRVGGTGLGLAISRRIIEMHRGRLDVESEAGRGSTFTITIPVKQRRRTVSVQLDAA